MAVVLGALPTVAADGESWVGMGNCRVSFALVSTLYPGVPVEITMDYSASEVTAYAQKPDSDWATAATASISCPDLVQDIFDCADQFANEPEIFIDCL